MTAVADVVIVGAGVHGASLAFHLAQRSVDVLVVERENVAAGATGRSSGFIRMHYDLESEARLAWASFPYFRFWDDLVGMGDPGFVRTGFLQLVPPELANALRANVAMQQALGIPALLVGPDDVARLAPGLVTDDVVVAAYEPESGYADPTGTAAGFLAAARGRGARLLTGCTVTAIRVAGERITGVDTTQGFLAAGTVVVAAGAWSRQLAATAGLQIPVEPWRHETIFLGRPAGQRTILPVVIDDANDLYFRPEGRDLLLVGLEDDNEVGGSPDRPQRGLAPELVHRMILRLTRRLPAMELATFRTAHGGQDGITPDQRAILGPAGPDGLVLACGFSGTGFKIAPAVGACLAEWICDGQPRTVDITPYRLERFATGQPLVGAHPYPAIWR
jgi:sarcosine oxidase subunit beta